MAPDLVAEIRAVSLTKAQAKELAAASRAYGGMRVVAAKDRREWRLELPEVHDLLTEEGDLAATTWRMDPDGLARLAETLEWLLDAMPDELTFQAAWPPRRTDVEVLVSRNELLQIVRQGRIGTSTRYRVLPSTTAAGTGATP
jgi:hypothetical protein